MARRAACFTLVILSCVGAFVAPGSRATFPSRTRARAEPLGATAADLLPGLLPGGGDVIAGSGNPDVIAAMVHDASPLLNVVNAGVGVGVGVAPPASDGGVSTAWTMLMSAAAPGDAYLATGLFGMAAAAIAVGAGVLVFSAVSGKDGLAAFLSKEKGNNPFYQDTITKFTPKTPEILNKIRLPELDFVEVYNQPPAAEDFEDEDSTFEMEGGAQEANVVATAEGLRQRLVEAVQAKDYDLASSLERELASFLRRNDMNFEDDAN